jgi:hypothetical protein
MWNFSVEFSIFAYSGDGGPPQVEPMRATSESLPPGREAQATEAIGDELKALKANGFAMGEATICQTFTIGEDGEHK